MNLYQICRYFIGRIVCLLINLTLLKKDIGDTQAGLKGFVKPGGFNNLKFISIGSSLKFIILYFK